MRHCRISPTLRSYSVAVLQIADRFRVGRSFYHADRADQPKGPANMAVARSWYLVLSYGGGAATAARADHGPHGEFKGRRPCQISRLEYEKLVLVIVRTRDHEELMAARPAPTKGFLGGLSYLRSRFKVPSALQRHEAM
eukprot:6191435-Pleurochrysis_carterae.AAC.1